MSYYFTDSHPTARVPHRCEVCGDTIQKGEKYRRGAGMDGNTAWTWIECLYCERVAQRYGRETGASSGDEYDAICVIEWLQDEYPIELSQMRARWRTPEGERLPLPFQWKCVECRTLLDGYRLWCDPCDDARIERLNQQFLKLAKGTLV